MAQFDIEIVKKLWFQGKTNEFLKTCCHYYRRNFHNSGDRLSNHCPVVRLPGRDAASSSKPAAFVTYSSCLLLAKKLQYANNLTRIALRPNP